MEWQDDGSVAGGWGRREDGARAGALWSAPARQDAEGDNGELDVDGARCASGTDKGALFIVVELGVADERPQPAEFLVGVGKAVGKREEVRTDHDLEGEVGEEEGAMLCLVAKALV